MQTTIRYFASVRETMGCASETVDLPPQVQTMEQARAWLAGLSPRHALALGADKVLRMACDQVMAQPGDALVPGRELAFFPPVTGG